MITTLPADVRSALNTRFGQYVFRRRREHGERFNLDSLAEKWIEHFNSGSRIEVRFSCGTVKRGTVAATTGWVPSFLLIRTSRSLGSSWLLGEHDELVKIVRHGPRLAPGERWGPRANGGRHG